MSELFLNVLMTLATLGSLALHHYTEVLPLLLCSLSVDEV